MLKERKQPICLYDNKLLSFQLNKSMRERVEPSMSFMEKTRYEMEHEEELLAERLAKLKEIREMKDRGETPTDYSSK